MIVLLCTFAGVNVLFMPVFVLVPFFVRDVLERGPEWYGFLLSGSAGGALHGSAGAGELLRRLPGSERPLSTASALSHLASWQ
jgi:hypothetical protein